MKRKWALALLLSFGACPTLAGSFHMGILGGVNFSAQTYRDLFPNTRQEVLFRYGGGFFSEFGLSDRFSLQTEVILARRGNYFKFDDPFFISEIQDYLYLDLPVLAKVRVPLAGHLDGFLVTGPSVGILLQQKTTTVTTSSNGDVDNTEYYPGTDFGWVFGAGLALEDLFLDIRFQLGLVSAAPKAIPNPESGLHRVLSAQMGYRLF